VELVTDDDIAEEFALLLETPVDDRLDKEEVVLEARPREETAVTEGPQETVTTRRKIDVPIHRFIFSSRKNPYQLHNIVKIDDIPSAGYRKVPCCQNMVF
jgi:hypothetical protein